MQEKNPFNIIFGMKPQSFIVRQENREEILNDFKNSEHGSIAIVTGVRGSGKTVFLSDIAKELGMEKNWITIMLNPELNLYENAFVKLNKALKTNSIHAKFEFNLSPLTISVNKDQPNYSSLEAEIEDLLKIASKKNKKVLFMIDEITNNIETKQFLSSFQIFLRSDLPIYILASGLPNHIYDLQDEKTLTFLYRAPKIEMTPLNIANIRMEYKKLLNINDETAIHMAKLTKGYSYGYQLLGDLVWKNNKQYDESLLEAYDIKLAEFVYDKIYSELSEKDIQFTEAICLKNLYNVKDLCSYLKITPKQFSPYRDRLIKKGIIIPLKRGIFKIALPRFAEYIKERKLFE